MANKKKKVEEVKKEEVKEIKPKTFGEMIVEYSESLKKKKK